jgi:SAM-dependent methyltransferase
MTLYEQRYFEMRRRNAEQRAAAYKQEYERVNFRSRGKYLLDYGCGDGAFTEQFQGWHKYGVEVSEYCISLCLAKNIRIIDTHDLKDGTLDLVIFRGVLQHIDEPFTALREAARLLRRGGTLAILAQPDADSLCYKLFGDLPALDAPRNWWIPGRRELQNILHKLNFDKQEVIYPYWGGPYAKPWRDFTRFALRLIGIRKSFAWPGNMIELYAQKGYRK